MMSLKSASVSAQNRKDRQLRQCRVFLHNRCQTYHLASALDKSIHPPENIPFFDGKVGILHDWMI